MSFIHFTKSTYQSNLHGFCLEIDARRSVIGQITLDRLLKRLDRKTIPRAESKNSFKFGDVVVKYLGLIEVGLETPYGVPDIMVLMDIVPVNVLDLLDLDVLDS